VKTSTRLFCGMAVVLMLLLCVLAVSAHSQTVSDDTVKCATDYCLDSISLTAPKVIGGSSVDGRVTLSRPADRDVELTLAVDPPLTAKVPSSVTIKEGGQSATFTVVTSISKIAVGGEDNAISIYANYGVTKHADLTVLAPVSFDRMVNSVIARERAFVANLKNLHPLAETYIQNIQEDKQHVILPTSDQYFLGRLNLGKSTEDQLFEQAGKKGRMQMIMSPLERVEGSFSRRYIPRGFANMAILDRDLNKDSYYFNFVRQEFLGEVRCIVVDLQPRAHAHKGSFSGRIWIEDKEFNIVRFNGTYSGTSNYNQFFHFDSWRVNVQPGLWLPSYVYSEESGERKGKAPFKSYHFKAQTRFWDYDEAHIKHQSELTEIRVDDVQDNSEDATRAMAMPIEAQRAFERMAEDNAIDHLQREGLISPPGPVDTVLQTVVNNLVITNKLEIIPEVRCRVLLTTPIESFFIGHTIVVSRGLIDTLPDEAALAMVLSHELAHIALGHKINTKLAFTDRFFFGDSVTFQRLDFGRSQLDEQTADTKALELLNNSPYKDNLAAGGLFLRQVEARAKVLPNLIRPHLGNPLGNKNTTRLAPVANAAPQLEKKVDQIAALSLGARIDMNPWSNQIAMMSSKRVTLLNAEERMPLEVTPFSPYLIRLGAKTTAEDPTVKEATKR
jgi:hypothetical protein